MATIRYRGEDRELRIGNAALMRYEQAGGDLQRLIDGKAPVTEAVTLVCSALGLPGDPVDHADDLPPLTALVEAVKVALDEAGLTDTEDAPGE